MKCARGAQPVKEVNLERKLDERNIGVAGFLVHGIMVQQSALIPKASIRPRPQ